MATVFTAPAARIGRSGNAMQLRSRGPVSRPVIAAASAGAQFKEMRQGVKEPASETLLTPRFYTTDFDEMEQMFNTEFNPVLNEDEFVAVLEEFRSDYNQTHFVRDATFKEAADKIEGATRSIFIEFLERSCTAEFSGFLLYKELGRRLKKTNPVIAEIFTLMSRDEARHAGFLNKALADFNLALDLGFMTKTRKYTFFKPKFIFYATYLSEKIGYWRYITIYRHLQKNPDSALYPIFKKFENWCQDENRHGDFFSALLKSQPQFLNDWQVGKLGRLLLIAFEKEREGGKIKMGWLIGLRSSVFHLSGKAVVALLLSLRLRDDVCQ